MMKAPTELELNRLTHMYDANYARQYYLRTRKLKGRNKGSGESENARQQRSALKKADPNWRDPRTGKSMDQIMKEARAKARTRITEQVGHLEDRLKKIEAKIKEKEREAASEDRKGKAKKERARKEAEKPKTAAEKAEAARENEKYRDKHKQELKSKSKKDKSSTPDKPSEDKKSSGGGVAIAELKTLATKVKGKIAVAKQKLAAL